MSNSFVESMWRGLQIGHQVEQDKRLEAAAQQQAQAFQMQAQEHQMKMQQYAQGLIQRDAYKKAAAEPEGAFKDLPPLLREHIKATGEVPAQAWDLVKPKSPERPIAVSPGQNLVRPGSGEVVYTAPDKHVAPERPIAVSPGQNLVRPGSGEVVYTAPNKPSAEPEKWTDPYTIKVAGKPITVRRNLTTNKVEKIAEDVSTTVRIAQTGQMTDKDIIMPQVRALPKMKENAVQAQKRVQLYENLTEMAEKGAGGLVPGLKAALSPVLEALGMDAKIESEAQAYQLMARAGVGSMRLMLVGSGQVSNYEQDLMQRLSGGSIKTSREAAKLLFKYYAQESRATVLSYNQTIKDLAEAEPRVGMIYKPIQMKEGATAGPSAGDVQDGYRFKGGNPADRNSWEAVK